MRSALFLFSLFFSQVLFGQVNLNQGLVAYYPFSGNSNDQSGNNNNPVFNNATLTADRFGNPNGAYYFNGVDNYIQIPNNITLTPQEISLCAIVKPMGFYMGTCYNTCIIDKGSPDYLPGDYSLRYTASAYLGFDCNTTDTTRQNFEGRSYNNPSSPLYTPYVTDDTWYCLVYTVSADTLKMYVDGILKWAGLKQYAIGVNSMDLFFGRKGDATYPYWFKGVIDEIRIYNRAINQDEVDALCALPSCNTWLSVPSQPSYVDVGDLDVPGNQITVEALLNSTLNNNGFGDIVSKHSTFGDVNYLLRAYSAEITTTTGYYKALAGCPISPDKTYHVAMVYDGAFLKFYRNGFLLAQVAASGDLVLNDWHTWIGFFQPQSLNENFIGYINEVRIWDVARTQTQIRAYMNSSLPNPTTEPGLLAYYVFDDLSNKQGNPTWNGTLGGSAMISATNPNCNFTADSCDIIPVAGSDSIIINNYTPVIALNPCDNKITVEDASAFNIGDTVLMIQMKGATIDSSNTSNFGTVTDYRSAGNYEFNYVRSKSGNVIELKNRLTRKYDIPNGKVQLIRVPYYQTANITSTLTCLPWDGTKGGVTVLNVKNDITLNADIAVSGKGFRGGAGYNPQNTNLDCFQNNYSYPISSNADAAQKGESIAIISDDIICGKGNPAGGGGGGLGHNSGGGGGGNGGQGGFGGYQLEPCGNSPYDNRGIGGHPLGYNTLTNKIFLGSGGGAGHADNSGNLPNSGGNGGGIIIIRSNSLKSNNHKIISDGDDGVPCTMPPSADCHDGMGGGGAGGSILLDVNQILDNSITENKGGKGANMVGSVPLGGRIGAGGGGGGGMLFLKTGSFPVNLTNTNIGGTNGVLTTDNNNAWGATPGVDGVTLFDLKIPIDSVLFTPNIDSVRIKDTTTGCSSFDFDGLAYTNANPVGTWQWDFGDNTTGNSQNQSHTYNAGTGTNYTIKLVVVDINGCKDSSFTTVKTSDPPTVKTNNDTAFCPGIQIQLSTTGAANYSWSPSAGLNDPNIANPVATPNSTTQYIVTGTTTNGCFAKDTVNITIYAKPVISKSNDTIICKNSSAQLFAGGGTVYTWSPSTSLDNNSIPDPVATPASNTVYYVTVKDGNTCTNADSIKVSIRPDPVFSISNPANVCENGSVQLSASGGNLYLWQPAVSLNDPSVANPFASPQITTDYSVVITDTICNNTSTLFTTVTVSPLPKVVASKSNDLDCSRDFSQLNATGAVQYVWSPPSTLNNANIVNPTAKPTTQTLYIVKGTDANGCTNYDSIMVNITGLNASGYFMPSAFTPNNDGLNDCYGIKYWGIIEDLDFGIYNRWGERIFHTSNPNDCWDGTYKGVKQNPDVYVYLITAKTFCGIVFRKGTFVLIR